MKDRRSRILMQYMGHSGHQLMVGMMGYALYVVR